MLWDKINPSKVNLKLRKKMEMLYWVKECLKATEFNCKQRRMSVSWKGDLTPKYQF